MSEISRESLERLTKVELILIVMGMQADKEAIRNRSKEKV